MPEVHFLERRVDTTGLNAEALVYVEKIATEVNRLREGEIKPYLGTGINLFLDIFDTLRVSEDGKIYCRVGYLKGGNEFEIQIRKGRVYYIDDKGVEDIFSELGFERIAILLSRAEVLKRGKK